MEKSQKKFAIIITTARDAQVCLTQDAYADLLSRGWVKAIGTTKNHLQEIIHDYIYAENADVAKQIAIKGVSHWYGVNVCPDFVKVLQLG